MPDFEARKTSKPKGAIVIATSYTALAVVRSLGRRGLPICVVSNHNSPAIYSRYVSYKFDLPKDEQDQVNLLLQIAEVYELKGWSIFPDGDKNASMLAKNYGQLSSYYQLTTPVWDVLKWAIDKKNTYQMAAELRVAFPRVFYPRSLEDIGKIDGLFPMIIKPTNHQGEDAFSNSRAYLVQNHDELVELYNEMIQITDASVILVQEMIPNGPGVQFSYAALCKEGKVLADMFVERKRLSPAQFGVSTYVVSLDDLEIKEPARLWLDKVGYTGLVEIDFILDRRDGIYKMLDVNARPWGWVEMSAYAGVDFPYLMWCLSQGQDIKEVHGRGGIGWARTLMDIEEMIRSTPRLISWGFIKSLLSAKHEMYVADDLKPAFVELWQLLVRAYRKVLKVLGLYNP